MIREFVRAHTWLKNFLSIVELIIKSILRLPIGYEADYLMRLIDGEVSYSSTWYYSIVHVQFGHIPMPLIPHWIQRYILSRDSHYVGKRFHCEDIEVVLFSSLSEREENSLPTFEEPSRFPWTIVEGDGVRYASIIFPRLGGEPKLLAIDEAYNPHLSYDEEDIDLILNHFEQELESLEQLAYE